MPLRLPWAAKQSDILGWTGHEAFTIYLDEGLGMIKECKHDSDWIGIPAGHVPFKWQCISCGLEMTPGEFEIYKNTLKEYQRGLNDGLEQAARICDERAESANIEGDKNSFYEAEECAEAIRAQIKK